MNSHEIVHKVTTRIIEQLEAGVNPWKCAWDRSGGQFGIPSNPKTKDDYRGINIPILWNAADLAGYQANLWLGFNQARELGGKVKKDEKGTHGVIYKPLIVDDDQAEDGKRTIPMMKTFVVFNLEQIDGLEHLLPPPPEVGEVFDPIPIAEEILYKSRARIVETGTRAFYRRSDDSITLPERFRFNVAEDFYATALHELTHWTGHERRLDRQWGKRFGDHAYAFEELVAEMGSAFLSAKLGLKGDLQHASYLDSWIKVLKQDNRALFKAASQAQKALEYIYTLMEEPQIEAWANEELTVAEPVSVAYAVVEERPQPEQPYVLLPSGLRRTPKRLIPPIVQGVLNL